jgi:hypothetical protein
VQIEILLTAKANKTSSAHWHHPGLALSIRAAELRLVLWDTLKGLRNNLILTQLSGFFNRKYEFHAQKLREALAQGPQHQSLRL